MGLTLLNQEVSVFLDHTQRRTTVGRSPLNELSVRRRDLYLTTHKTHNRQTSMPRVGFEPTIPVGERPQTYALDRAATGTGKAINITVYKSFVQRFANPVEEQYLANHYINRFVKFIPLWCIMLQLAQVLPSIHATCFGRTDHPRAFNVRILTTSHTTRRQTPRKTHKRNIKWGSQCTNNVTFIQKWVLHILCVCMCL